MTTLQEAARDALKALEHIQHYIGFRTATVHQRNATWYQSDDAIKSLKAALAQQGQEPEIAMIDAAMVEMANIHPPLKRSECQRLIRAALSAAPAPQAQEPCPNGSKCKHGAWCTEVYCQELCEFRNQPAPQTQEPHVWMIQGSHGTWKGEHAEPTDSYDLAKRADNGGQP